MPRLALSNPQADPVSAARAAGLRHVSDTQPGIHRHRSGKSFRYTTPDNKPLRDPETLARIKSLVIPPAWTDVWICPLANGHLQATGRDARHRKQSRYHPQWRAFRDETKYHRMAAFAEALPHIRRQVEHDLVLPGLPREKVLATIISLMESTHIRVGNEEYARTNQSFGLTTLKNKHVDIHGNTVTFSFQGKSKVHHTINLHDRRLARIIRRCEDLPGQDLFQYVDSNGATHAIDSTAVNDYLRQITASRFPDEHFTAKDFRTWAGSVLACITLLAFEPFTSETQAKKNLVAAIKTVAAHLGNTPSVCRKCYIHPAVLDHYLTGDPLPAPASLKLPPITSTEAEALDIQIAEHTATLRKEERILLDLLAQRAKL